MGNIKRDFLIKYILGRDINMSQRDAILRKCVGLAYRDMLDAGRFYISSDMENRCDEFIQILNQAGYKFSREMIKKVSYLFGDTEEIHNSERKYATRFGLAQKFVNMTFKYLYVIF